MIPAPSLVSPYLASLPPVNESGIYTEADLKPYQARLVELREFIREGDPANKDEESRRGTVDEMSDERQRDEAMTKLMYEKWDECGTSLSPFL